MVDLVWTSSQHIDSTPGTKCAESTSTPRASGHEWRAVEGDHRRNDRSHEVPGRLAFTSSVGFRRAISIRVILSFSNVKVMVAKG